MHTYISTYIHIPKYIYTYMCLSKVEVEEAHSDSEPLMQWGLPTGIWVLIKRDRHAVAWTEQTP